ncbi:MAG: hypothetical protein ACLUIQ_10090 [Dialister invisus]
MIMLGFMETEKEFIKIGRNTGRGRLPAVSRLLVPFGIIVIPLMLTAINPDIWSTVRMDQLAEEAATFSGSVLALYSSFPAYRAGHVG